MKLSGKRKKALIALGFVAFILVAFGPFSLIPLRFDELWVSAKSLTVAGVTQTSLQRTIEFDADGDLVFLRDPWPFGHYEGYRYPTVRYNVEYSGIPAKIFDNVTVKKQINETHTEVTKVAIWEYIFYARIDLIPQNDVVIGVRSAFEGNGPGEWHGDIFTFKAIMEVELKPFEGREDKILGITWMQFKNMTVDWGRWKTVQENSLTIGYEPEMDVSNVGEVWGNTKNANEVLGRTLPMIATISIQGLARAGCYAYYEPSIIPGRLYQYVDCSPSVECEIVLHVAGENVFVEGQGDPDPDGDPIPPVPPEPFPWLLLIVGSVLFIIFMAVAAPRLIRAWRAK